MNSENVSKKDLIVAKDKIIKEWQTFCQKGGGQANADHLENIQTIVDRIGKPCVLVVPGKPVKGLLKMHEDIPHQIMFKPKGKGQLMAKTKSGILIPN
jgi:hypothetical protein